MRARPRHQTDPSVRGALRGDLSDSLAGPHPLLGNGIDGRGKALRTAQVIDQVTPVDRLVVSGSVPEEENTLRVMFDSRSPDSHIGWSERERACEVRNPQCREVLLADQVPPKPKVEFRDDMAMGGRSTTLRCSATSFDDIAAAAIIQRWIVNPVDRSVFGRPAAQSTVERVTKHDFNARNHCKYCGRMVL